MRASVIFIMMSPTKISRSAVTPIDGVMILKQFYYLNPRLELSIYIALVILGIIIQTMLYRKSLNQKQMS